MAALTISEKRTINIGKNFYSRELSYIEIDEERKDEYVEKLVAELDIWESEIKPFKSTVIQQTGSDACSCGKPLREGVVKKEGANKGRKYKACSDFNCKLKSFTWID